MTGRRRARPAARTGVPGMVGLRRSVRPASGAAARAAGRLLVLTAAATVVAVAGRLSAGADQPALADSLAAIAANAWRYGAGGAGRLVSGLTLIGAAWYLPRICAGLPSLAIRLAAGLLSASGACTAVSGAYAVLMAVAVRDVADARALAAAAGALEVAARLRPLFGEIGFVLAGWALIVMAPGQWRVETARARVGRARGCGAARLDRCRDRSARRYRRRVHAVARGGGRPAVGGAGGIARAPAGVTAHPIRATAVTAGDLPGPRAAIERRACGPRDRGWAARPHDASTQRPLDRTPWQPVVEPRVAPRAARRPRAERRP